MQNRINKLDLYTSNIDRHLAIIARRVADLDDKGIPMTEGDICKPDLGLEELYPNVAGEYRSTYPNSWTKRAEKAELRKALEGILRGIVREQGGVSQDGEDLSEAMQMERRYGAGNIKTVLARKAERDRIGRFVVREILRQLGDEDGNMMSLTDAVRVAKQDQGFVMKGKEKMLFDIYEVKEYGD